MIGLILNTSGDSLEPYHYMGLFLLREIFMILRKENYTFLKKFRQFDRCSIFICLVQDDSLMPFCPSLEMEVPW